MVREGEEHIDEEFSLGVIGVSYRETALQQREQVLQFLQQAQLSFYPKFPQEEGRSVLLSTCHRVELYGMATEAIFSTLEKEIREMGAIPYFYRNQDCFSHLFCVVGGMDSLVLGETEIQGQVKRAYLQAIEEQKLAFALHFLFQKALKEGKVFRTKRSSPSTEITIPAFVQHELQKQKMARSASLLFMGYSEINRSVAYYLQKQGFSRITFCSRQPLSLRSMDQVLREEVCFQDPYHVIFLGSSELRHAFPRSLWEGVWDFPGRLVFDFAVPRALPVQPACRDRYIDMEQISDWLRQHQKEVFPLQLDSLREVVYRYWESLNRRLARRRYASV
ncbi:glutamyl-tRNA reductase [Chlamydia muridarum str. Nigg]|uniref:glutamyl-tRNA reductase n=1 Tax=Chlamydia muridarum TaxID=83560 RepID=UPI0004D9EF53|nr:glutamyl-tRNA reductase [Chlamydia muridarum]AVM87845.1 glutamyl-tRNA reductase [Chlamydia muridarum str. Nigg]AVM88724.1 glutamyl-tRNA reductase [Chlamydia muridarum str. Nigg]AVM90523.1 glutamyl-tRNA reductase [Chlamydia muridarum str. Nigg]AVM91420.1 glutamyl-tRNA reductase [Chlamydia muridarum str. Nigg]AVM94979.1 glutamyl-tRNA reductase [Chlamydia muridarum str. Nigg]